MTVLSDFFLLGRTFDSMVFKLTVFLRYWSEHI